jgi:predicted alpha/beta hydrolase family esterase
MKNTLILHGTGGYPTENWFDWLRQELNALRCSTMVPQLPGSDKPNLRRYNHFLLDELKYDFNEQTILIGHSSGAVAILGLLQALPDGVRVDTCYLIGSFKDDLGWEALRELFDPVLDLASIKNKAKHFVFIHADNDPYCPLEHAEFLAKELGGELIVKEGQKHFSIGTMGESYKTFPFLLELIKERNLS